MKDLFPLPFQMDLINPAKKQKRYNPSYLIEIAKVKSKRDVDELD